MANNVWEVSDLGCDDETRQAVGGLDSLSSLYEVVKLAYLTPAAKEEDGDEIVSHIELVILNSYSGNSNPNAL